MIVQQQLYQHTFANGLTLLAERMDHVRSAAVYIQIPAGCVYDPPSNLGLARVLSELITRGAGKRDKRELTTEFDRLGIDHGESVGLMSMPFWASTLARNLPLALRLLADIIRRPHLPEEELEACQEQALMDLSSLEDEPSSRVRVALRKHLYPAPLSNDHRGTEEGVASLTLPTLRAFYEQHFHPQGTIIGVAGNISWQPLLDLVGELFGDWKGSSGVPIQLGPEPSKRAHLHKELEQTQIALAYRSVPIGHPDYYQAVGAVEVLSGGMGARLFTEIREKEGLCYSVGAGHTTLKDRASVMAFAASLNHQAQRTLDKLIEELQRLPRGIDEEEVERVRVGQKTALIMSQESTGGRAASLVNDWYFLGRIRRFEERLAAINALTPASILAHLERFPPGDFSIVTLGPKPLIAS